MSLAHNAQLVLLRFLDSTAWLKQPRNWGLKLQGGEREKNEKRECYNKRVTVGTAVKCLMTSQIKAQLSSPDLPSAAEHNHETTPDTIIVDHALVLCFLCSCRTCRMRCWWC